MCKQRKQAAMEAKVEPDKMRINSGETQHRYNGTWSSTGTHLEKGLKQADDNTK